MSEQPNDPGGTGGQPPSRPGKLTWAVAAAAVIGFIIFVIVK